MHQSCKRQRPCAVRVAAHPLTRYRTLTALGFFCRGFVYISRFCSTHFKTDTTFRHPPPRTCQHSPSPPPACVPVLSLCSSVAAQDANYYCSMTKPNDSVRCEWVKLDRPLYVTYHDEEWGGGRKTATAADFRARYDGEFLFELLCLESQQAGLSWWTVLQKREAYRRAFHRFVPARVAAMDLEKSITPLLTVTKETDRVIAHRGKLEANVRNAQAYQRLTAILLKAQGDVRHTREGASRAFADYLWRFSYLRADASDVPPLPAPVVHAKSHLTFHPSPLVKVGKDGTLSVKKAAVTLRTETAASRSLSAALRKSGFGFVGATTCYAFMQACGMVNDHSARCRDLLPCESWRRAVWQMDSGATAIPAAITPVATHLPAETELLAIAALARPSTASSGKRRADRSAAPPAKTKKRRLAKKS